ncbi:MAG TPA: ABC transporter substrate-binding protein, partial [Rubellimicrobium sp.]|nr:ABC transporter substrate-binding protein [Rubellimicrobium sp.]
MSLRRRPAPPLRRLDSRVSRRGLLGAGVLAGVLAASGVPLQARTRGGVLRLGLARPLPLRGDWTRAPAVLAQGAVYDTLTEIGPTGDLSGELAQSWEAAPGARVWHLALRRDAVFHDGRPLTAPDVLASLARHRAGPAAWILDRVERIEPQGPQAALLTLHEGDPDLPFLLADPRLIIGPEGRL